ncbi:MAG: anti-sigma factor [Actinomycetota bacterium]
MRSPSHDVWALHLDPEVEVPPDLELDLGALDADERSGLDRLAGVLAAEAVWSDPPADLRARVLAGVAAEATERDDQRVVIDTGAWPGVAGAWSGGGARDRSRSRTRAEGRWFGSALVAVAAAAVAIVAMVAWTHVVNAADVTTYDVAGTELVPAASAAVDVEETGSGVALTLRPFGLPPAAPGEYYAGWLMGDAGMVGVGSFHLRDGPEPVELWSGVELEGHPRFMVTVQVEGEPPTPSDQVVLRGALVAP